MSVWPGGIVGVACENGHSVVVVLNPPGQYADDRNLRARQRLWQYQTPFSGIAGWVLSLAGLCPGLRVLDAGCGNGEYLRALAGQPVQAAGCDLPMGMLRPAAHRPAPALVAQPGRALRPRGSTWLADAPGNASVRSRERGCPAWHGV